MTGNLDDTRPSPSLPLVFSNVIKSFSLHACRCYREHSSKMQEEEEKDLPISDPAVCFLHQHIYATGGCVTGSDQLHNQLCSQIWVTSIILNPPSLWVMINPCKIHDPITQILTWKKNDMDNINVHLGPSKEQCTKNITLDPYTALKFFHFLIKTILATFFAIEVVKSCVKSHKGFLDRS